MSSLTSLVGGCSDEIDKADDVTRAKTHGRAEGAEVGRPSRTLRVDLDVADAACLRDARVSVEWPSCPSAQDVADAPDIDSPSPVVGREGGYDFVELLTRKKLYSGLLKYPPRGELRLIVPADGRYELRLRVLGENSILLGNSVVSIDGSDVDSKRVVMIVGAGRSVRGRVIDERGEPVEGVRAEFVVDDPCALWSFSDGSADATSGVDGVFASECVSPYASVVFVHKLGWAPVQRKLPMEKRSDLGTVVIEPGRRVTVDVVPRSRKIIRVEAADLGRGEWEGRRLESFNRSPGDDYAPPGSVSAPFPFDAASIAPSAKSAAAPESRAPTERFVFDDMPSDGSSIIVRVLTNEMTRHFRLGDSDHYRLDVGD